MRIHEDDRAKRFCDIFGTRGYDINVFVLQPGQRSGWHRHQRQTDRFFVVGGGSVRFGAWVDGEAPFYWMLRSETYRHTIFPGRWHGYENPGILPVRLLMCLDQKYDPTDEECTSFDDVPWAP